MAKLWMARLRHGLLPVLIKASPHRRRLAYARREIAETSTAAPRARKRRLAASLKMRRAFCCAHRLLIGASRRQSDDIAQPDPPGYLNSADSSLGVNLRDCYRQISSRRALARVVVMASAGGAASRPRIVRRRRVSLASSRRSRHDARALRSVPSAPARARGRQSAVNSPGIRRAPLISHASCGTQSSGSKAPACHRSKSALNATTCINMNPSKRVRTYIIDDDERNHGDRNSVKPMACREEIDPRPKAAANALVCVWRRRRYSAHIVEIRASSSRGLSRQS